MNFLRLPHTENTSRTSYISAGAPYDLFGSVSLCHKPVTGLARMEEKYRSKN
ncbi:hypothetical protein H8S90_14160 [Olivibacter sp. SDN3]|uniref:hypothetical protein n=1 Tax=Olivibacter sp. SDN3 TaxID=2764720 RepID=UPI001651A1F3|nr:hypothetical protein [Olivibacter sp. SDN3]QNL47959.1 hypothetical protein H8S90_14160 [Olivibacter sp. SDN3]